MRLLFPSDPFEKNKPDESFADEYKAALAIGLNCSLFASDDFDAGEFKPRPRFEENEKIVYRGWMLTPDNYFQLQKSIEAKGAKVLTTAVQYKFCHYLPEWYALCEDVTPKTIFLSKDSDFSTALKNLGWSAYFIKDYVKSLTTSRGSIAKTIGEISEIISLIEKYRGQVEGGVCVREFEELLPETEERYFVFNKKAFARDGIVPEIVEKIASRINSPFFSVDIVLSNNGNPRLMELGDGQVSGIKKWDANRFVEIFKEIYIAV